MVSFSSVHNMDVVHGCGPGHYTVFYMKYTPSIQNLSGRRLYTGYLKGVPGADLTITVYLGYVETAYLEFITARIA